MFSPRPHLHYLIPTSVRLDQVSYSTTTYNPFFLLAMLRTVPTLFRATYIVGKTAPLGLSQQRCASAQVENDGSTRESDITKGATAPSDKVASDDKKTVAQRDEELRRKMSGIAGDGGEAGIEYEDGKPVAMKRSVKNNMFRYI
ncbi:hypothetical protein F5Y18DRAFT_187003 [Xylariaceae sp. FL1019]|nr:hypothetical protein F5Y18DRAFT_187003 [Xylariaceae sp. FL1019]